MNREAEFVAQLWKALSDYLSKYAVGGRRLEAKPPNSVSLRGKIPDIVIVDEKGTPQLIIETKRKIDRGREDFHSPFHPAPIAQALCYAALALEEYKLEKTPMFATANKDVLVLFKGVERERLREIVVVEKCLEPKERPEDWEKVFAPEGVEKLLQNYMIDRVEYPLKEQSLKRIFDQVDKWLTNSQIPTVIFYKAFVNHLHALIESLHSYIEPAIKSKILRDRDYFERLFKKAKESGYKYGLLSGGLLSLRCPENSEKLCERLKERLLQEVGEGEITPEKAFNALAKVAGIPIPELCNELRKAGGSTPPLCREKGRAEQLMSFENLSKMMAYVLANKILAYKILELHYGDIIPTLSSIKLGQSINTPWGSVKIESPNDVISYLDQLFSFASKKLEERLAIRDFSPLFKTGLYDEVVLGGVDAVKVVNEIIEFIDGWKGELKKLPGIVGYVYEGLLPPSERHQLGQFYTPPAIARLITKWAIRSGNDKVLDPGCGSGTFLIEAYKRLLWLKYNKDYDNKEYPSCTEQYNEHQEVLNQLYGVDINAFAAHLSSVHLMLMEPRCPISKLNIETRDYFTLKKGSFAFGEVVEGFDVVVGNPPYTRWVEIPEETKKYILEELRDELRRYNLRPDVARGIEPGIYVYWIMHTAKNLLKEGGRLGMIISNMWLQTDYGVDFGKFLLDNFRIVVLIDLSYRLFDALISTVIILAEKIRDENARINNVVTLIRIPPIIDEKGGERLDKALGCIELAVRNDGSIDLNLLKRCRELGVVFTQLKQGDIPRDRKWISLFFGAEKVLEKLKTSPLIVKLGEWFEPSYGNALYLCLSSWGIVRGVRNLGAKDFFYFSEEKIREWGEKVPGFDKEIKQCLVPAITRSQYVKTFTFTRGDWEKLRSEKKDVYIFVCSKRVKELPEQVQKYIGWGETECRTRIRGTRGGGKPCSEAEACKARESNPAIFKGWYDLGGYIPTPLMAIYQAFYHPQFFYVDISPDWKVVTYHAIITFIPKVKIKTRSLTIDPEEFMKKYPFLRLSVQPGIELDEAELKALLAYLNSTFVWVWIEQIGRRTGGGIIALEVQHARDIPLLNVKNVDRKFVEELARLFDELESKARQLAKGEGDEEDEDEEGGVGGAKLKMFEKLKPYFQKMDAKIAEILRLDVDVNDLWSYAWEMMERRVKGARGVARPGAEESIDVDIKRGGRRRRSTSTSLPLDMWFS